MTRYDLGFVVDSSASIEQAAVGNYQRMRDFMEELVNSLVVGESDVHVGLVKFSTKNIQQLVFSFQYDPVQINNQINAMAYDAGHTYTGQALNFTRTALFPSARKRVPHLVLIVTDGAASDDVIVPSQLLRDNGAIIYALGIGCCYNNGQLKNMASDPDQHHVFAVSFEQLPTIINKLHENICEGERNARGNTIPYHTIRYDTLRYDTIRYATLCYDTIRYATIRYATIRYATIRYATIRYTMIRYDTIRYNSIQCNAIQINRAQHSTNP